MDWDWHLLVVITAALFGVFVIYKFRPAIGIGVGYRPSERKKVLAAKARLDAAKTDAERAHALAEAADACTRGGGSRSAAIGYYLRAMRLDPTSAELVERAAAGLVRRPRALESLLWRRLGSDPWFGETGLAAQAALRHLAELYSGPLKSAIRARALEHAVNALTEARRSRASRDGGSTPASPSAPPP
jgi:hypothetical protein